MKVGSTFAGIGGFDRGLELAGHETVWQVEIDKFCNRVLEKRWPHVKRYGDITAVDVRELEPVDILVGGFPCQDLSVAGRRAGLAGARSGLFYEFLRIADALTPRWLVIENVAGLLSSVSPVSASGGSNPDAFDSHDFHNGEDFAVLLEGLTGFRPAVPKNGWRSSGICTGPKRTAAWRVFDSRYFGVAQRRRRVFVVCGPGDAGAVALLSDAEGGRGDPAESRASWARIARASGNGAAELSGSDVAHPLLAKRGARMNPTDDTYVSGPAHALRARPNSAGREDAETYVTGPVGGGDYGAGRDGSNDFPNIAGPHVAAREVARPLTSSMRKHHDEDTDTIVAHSLTRKHSVTEDGTGRGTPVVATPLDLRQTSRGDKDTNDRTDGGAPGTGIGEPGDPAFTVSEREQGVAFTPLQDVGGTRKKKQNGIGVGAEGDEMYTLTKQDRHGVAYSMRNDASRDGEAKTPSADAEGRVRLRDPGLGIYEEIAPTLDAGAPHSVAHTLRGGSGFDGSEDGTGRGTPIVVDGPDVASTLTKGSHNDRPGGRRREDDQNVAVFRKSKRANSDTDDETWVPGDVANTQNQFDVGDKRATELALTFEPRYYTRDNKTGGAPNGIAAPLRSEDHAGDSAPHVSEVSGARRLTPTECERLQGFPDGWTCLCGVDPYDTNTCTCPDGPRYAVNGNAVTVNVIYSIGQRISAADPGR